MPPRTTFALADRQKDSCLHPSRPKRNIIQKEKAGNAPSLAHEKGHRQTDRQTHRQTTTTLIASGPPLRGDPYFVCISTTLLRNKLAVSAIASSFYFMRRSTAFTFYGLVPPALLHALCSSTSVPAYLVPLRLVLSTLVPLRIRGLRLSLSLLPRILLLLHT